MFKLFKRENITAYFNNGVLIKDGHNGVKFTYNDVKSLTAAVKRFESADQVVMGNNAYKDYINYYSKESNYEILYNIYKRILDENE